MAFLVAIYTERRIATNIIFMFLASTVVEQTDSRAVFGNMSKLLTVKTTNNRFFVLLTIVKNIYPLY